MTLFKKGEWKPKISLESTGNHRNPQEPTGIYRKPQEMGGDVCGG